MLTPLDDSLWHQIPSTFDHAGTSDPRFFDRFWFASYDPGGAGALQFTMGSYLNMNVLDAGCIVVRDGFQHNVRASRSLRPRFETAVGPFSVEVLEPMQRFRLHLAEGPHDVSGSLEWTASMPPEEEAPHFDRRLGRIVNEYQRFDQIGTCSGELQVGGTLMTIDNWWACRDHSWGVRPGMGIPEPAIGRGPGRVPSGTLFGFLFFSTNRLAGHVQLAESQSSRTYLHGTVHVRDDDGTVEETLDVPALRLEIEMHPGTRRFRTLVMHCGMEDGRELRLACDAIGPCIAMPGLGYSGGFDDGKGLGVWRGDEHLEHDVWDVRHAADVVRADGTVFTPGHRIQPVTVEAAGDAGLVSVGTGSMTLVATGSLPAYGL